MHIALVSETYYPEINGVALTVQALVEQLLAIGERVSLVRPERDQEVRDERCVLIETTVPGARLPRYPELRFGLPVRGRLLKLWRVLKPDVIYIATEGPLGWAAMSAAKRLSIPVISGFHTRFDTYMAHYGWPWMERLAFAYLRSFHQRAALTLVPTAALCTELRQRGLKNVECMPRAVDLQQFNPRFRSTSLRLSWGVGSADPVLICVGRIAPEKNLGLAIRAYAELRKTTPRAKMVMVGDGPLRGALSKLHPELIFTGTLRGQALAEAYASADLFVFPSLSETFGNVTLEAMASALPVVAFDYGAAREHLADGLHGARVALNNDDGFIRAVRGEAKLWSLGTRKGQAARLALASLHPRQLALGLLKRITELSTQKESSHGHDATRQMA